MLLLAVVGGTVMKVCPFSGMSLGDISTEKLRHKNIVNRTVKNQHIISAEKTRPNTNQLHTKKE